MTVIEKSHRGFLSGLRSHSEADMERKTSGAYDDDNGVVHYMDRWVDPYSAKGLTWLILSQRARMTCDDDAVPTESKLAKTQQGELRSSLPRLPDEVIGRCVARFLHFDTPIPGMIYIFGGRASKVLEPEHYLDTAECYDTFRNQWVTLPPMSTKRVGAASVVATSGLVYIFGGYSKHPDKPLSSGECFNPRTGEWAPISPMMRSRFGHTAQEYGKYIFVVGGDSRRHLVTEIERYDTESDKWEVVGLLPRPVAGGRILARDGKLYLVGGDVGTQPLSFTDAIRVYDPMKNTWSTLERKLGMGRSACAVTWCGEGSSQIAVIGGYAAENDTFFELKSSEVIDTSLEDSACPPRVIPPMPEPRAGCRAVTIGTKIYVIGGESPEVRTSVEDSLPDSVAGNFIGSLFDQASTASGRAPLVNARDILLQALQQRLSLRTGPSVDDHAPRIPGAMNIRASERKPHSTVAVFDTEKWQWETDTPCMATARTAASVCVGSGYSASFGWNTSARWVTEKRLTTEEMDPCRPQAASG
jgi:hypothetical protein